MRIVIVIEDADMGSVKIVSTPPASDLMEKIPGGLGAASSASMYALGMMTWAANRSREMGGKPNTSLIELPRGTRGA